MAIIKAVLSEVPGLQYKRKLRAPISDNLGKEIQDSSKAGMESKQKSGILLAMI